MDILLLRHGKAGKRKEYTGNDRFRPLTDEGIQDLILIAGWLRRQFPDPGIIATSPLTRVGHEPDLSKFGAFVLTGRNDSFFALSKGGLAVLNDVNPVQAGSGSLYLLMPARLMR
jgi:phosphohistidine phosphatase SixA